MYTSVVGKTAGLDRFYAAVGRCAEKRGRQQDASGHGEGALKMAKLVGTLCGDRALVSIWLVLWGTACFRTRTTSVHKPSARPFFDEHPLSRHGLGDSRRSPPDFSRAGHGSWRCQVPTSSRAKETPKSLQEYWGHLCPALQKC